MKIGVIFCGYNMKGYIPDSLMPWIKAKKRMLGGNEFVLSAASIPFQNYPNDDEDGTMELLANEKRLDAFFTEPHDIPEWEARDLCLQYLLEKDCDLIWQVDFDEFFTVEQIENILHFVKKDPFIAWYRVSYQNYVFTEKVFLEEPFTPPRIHRVKMGRYRLNRFVYDNDLSYVEFGSEKEVNQNQLGNKTIPKDVAWIKHLTWLNDERSRRKVEYHNSRGWICSYKWTENGLEFNEEYYSKYNLPKPSLFTE